MKGLYHKAMKINTYHIYYQIHMKYSLLLYSSILISKTTFDKTRLLVVTHNKHSYLILISKINIILELKMLPETKTVDNNNIQNRKRVPKS